MNSRLDAGQERRPVSCGSHAGEPQHPLLRIEPWNAGSHRTLIAWAARMTGQWLRERAGQRERPGVRRVWICSHRWIAAPRNRGNVSCCTETPPKKPHEAVDPTTQPPTGPFNLRAFTVTRAAFHGFCTSLNQSLISLLSAVLITCHTMRTSEHAKGRRVRRKGRASYPDSLPYCTTGY